VIETVAFSLVGSIVGISIYTFGRSTGYREGFKRGVDVGAITARTIMYGIRQELRSVLALDEKGASIAHGFDPLLKESTHTSPTEVQKGGAQ